jgi:hypothetical protein
MTPFPLTPFKLAPSAKSKLSVRVYFALPDIGQDWAPVFRADVAQGGKGFQLFQLV